MNNPEAFSPANEKLAPQNRSTKFEKARLDLGLDRVRKMNWLPLPSQDWEFLTEIVNQTDILAELIKKHLADKDSTGD